MTFAKTFNLRLLSGTQRHWLRLLVAVLTVAVFANGLAYASAPLDAAGARQKIVARGLGKEVKVVRFDGSEVRGFIVTISDDSVVLQPKDAAGPVTVAFHDIAREKNVGNGMSKGAKIGIGVAVGFVVAAAVSAIVIDHQLNGKI